MKAKEYAQNFVERIKQSKTDGEVTEAIYDIFVEFMKEGQSLVETRKVQLDTGLISVIKEQSDKWKVFSEIVNAKYNMTLINPNGFKDLVKTRIPELKDKI